MATTQTFDPLSPDGKKVANRMWMEFAYHGFARIIARKHGLVVPDIELANLTDEELEQRYNVVRELAHLPPA